jgi:myo-inositol 2-dehydrogenase / D-chiro-inositol 1-dehydrogenase
MSRTDGRLRVGLIGCGEAGQVIHLPHLARLGALFHVAAVMDVDRELAEGVADRVGATGYDDVELMLDTEALDVLVVAGPDRFHADHVAAGARSGVPLVLCEKPIVTTREDLARVREDLARGTTSLVAGTMHLYDPAVRQLLDCLEGQPPGAFHLVHSRVLLPANAVVVRAAADMVAPQNRSGPGAPLSVADLVLSLSMHDVPLIRRLVRRPGRVLEATWVDPLGYDITVESEDSIVRLTALIGGHWDADWTLTGRGADQSLTVSFPPSYIAGGSAEASLTAGGRTRVWRGDVSGYHGLYRHVHAVATGRRAPSTGDALDDVAYTLSWVEGIDALGKESA